MIKLVEIKNRKGNILRGIISLPDGIEKPSVVLNLHGFGGTLSGHRSSHTHLSRVLAKSNIGCARFDFYGNGESDGEFEEMTFTSLLEDTEDIYNWLKDQEFVDKDKIILSGHSMGGFVAASSAPKLKPFGLMLLSPGAGMWYGCKERSDELRNQGIEFGDMEGLKINVEFNYDLAKYNPFEDAKGYDGPVLIVRGTADPLVSNEICEQYMDLYKEKKDYIQIEGANHNFASIPARAACEAAVLEFVQEIQ